jgi:farnesyl-diphosphate farnesyltransferase
MTLPNDVKQSLLRSYHTRTVTPGWNFEGSGPNEKDRILLVDYHNVVEELNSLTPELVYSISPPFVLLICFRRYKSIILDVTRNMEVGMADYAQAASETGDTIRLTTIANYNQYCHYAGGIVGESLPRMFSVSGKESNSKFYIELAHSWALLIQKADLIQDHREDVDQKRYLWPEEIWSRKEYGFSALRELYEAVEADGGIGTNEKAKKALYVQSEMTLDALRHATDSLDYLSMVQCEGLLTASSRLSCVSIANLELCFMNREVFLWEPRFTNGEFDKVSRIFFLFSPITSSLTCSKCLQIMSSNPTVHDTATTFRDYVRKIQARADVSDPNFLQISIICEKVRFIIFA